MRQYVNIPGGVLTLANSDFNCPTCGQLHQEKDWFPKLGKSDNRYITKMCKNKACKELLGITMDYMGDVVCWKHNEEQSVIDDLTEYHL